MEDEGNDEEADGNEEGDEKLENEEDELEAVAGEEDNEEEGDKPSFPYVGINSGVETELASIRLSMRAGWEVAGIPDEGLYEEEGGTKPVFPAEERRALIFATKSSTFSEAEAGGISATVEVTLIEGAGCETTPTWGGIFFTGRGESVIGIQRRQKIRQYKPHA